MQSLLLALRSTLFYVGYIILTAWFSLSAVIFFSFAPLKVRSFYLRQWNTAVVWWLRISCGVTYEIEGKEHLNQNEPFVLLSKHQSQWETFFITSQVKPLSAILKQELLKIPAFGWALKLNNPIAIDRSSPKKALKTVMEEGKKRLANGISVLVFPEGTRTAPGEEGTYARSGASLAISAKVPVIFMAHDAGNYWPARKFLKHPGKVKISISKPLETAGKTSKELTQMAKDWIEEKSQQFAAATPA